MRVYTYLPVMEASTAPVPAVPESSSADSGNPVLNFLAGVLCMKHREKDGSMRTQRLVDRKIPVLDYYPVPGSANINSPMMGVFAH